MWLLKNIIPKHCGAAISVQNQHGVFFLHFATASLDLLITKTSKISNSILLSEYNSLSQIWTSLLQLSTLQNVTRFLTSSDVIFPFKILHRHWPCFTSWNTPSSILPPGIRTRSNLFLVVCFIYFSSLAPSHPSNLDSMSPALKQLSLPPYLRVSFPVIV